MTKANDIETTVVDETKERTKTGRSSKNTLSESVENIKNRLGNINGSATEISSRVLEKYTTKEVDSINRSLTEAVFAIDEMMPKTHTKSLLTDLMNKIPWAKKIKENIHKTVLDNVSAKENIDKIFDGLERHIDEMNADAEDMAALMTSLDDSEVETQQLKLEIQRELDHISSLTDPQEINNKRMDLRALQQLQVELGSLELINKQAANDIDMNLRSSQVLTLKIHEVKPLLKSVLSAQLALAAQTQKNIRVQETTQIVSTIVNNTVIESTKNANESLRQTIALAAAPIIKNQTLVELDKQLLEDANKMKKMLIGIQSDASKYAESQKRLANSIDKNTLTAMISETEPKKKAIEVVKEQK